ncbi:helix-turn-helix domain containing protein [Citrobacter portucalensis]|uniref:helix-turn-helix domain-containing protein n=1 Tax=Citrobacter portucalensis TaxID=1639133 RepID=UPI00226B6810|nr:helix-turn-helix domain-containing protein [Citrobacter portucalensis]MCX9038971.1 helix-turn-helix domain containing protein [Citrobacter portucalensis]
MSSKSAVAVIGRLKELLKAESDSALCELINLSPQTLSSWKSRDKVPYALCVDYSEIMDVSLEWLLTGKGERLKQRHAANGEEMTSRERCWLEVFRELPDEVQKNILHDAEKEKRLFELEQEVQQLKEAAILVSKHKNTG